MVDIFKDTKEQTVPSWAKFTNAGDKVQGTYIGKIVGQIDGYGNEQIIYQLLQEDDSVVNVGFGLNKKVLNEDMSHVNFGQIIGFNYKGMVTFKDKRTGKDVNVKDFGFHQNPEIVNEKWLKENKDNMPIATVVMGKEEEVAAQKEYDSWGKKEGKEGNDVPFSSKGSVTDEDKLAVITKLAKEKLGATTPASVKEKVMEKTSIAFIPVQYKNIIDALTAI